MWKCGSFEFDTRKPVIMGILNVTPDSFSDGGTHNTPEAALAWAQQMLDEGAHMIDVGGESTRPGSAEVSVEEEAARVLPVVRALAEQGVCVSIDTRHAAVAKACVEAGAAIINDVSGFRDPAMVQVAAQSDCGVVVMHMKGEPGTMQQNPQYDDVVAEVRDYLRDQAAMLEAAGVSPERICIDPGPGFGKTASQTLELVRNFPELARLGYPVMVAVIMAIFFRERISLVTVLSISLALCGIALLYRGEGGAVLNTAGVVLVMASSLSYALYIVVVNRASLNMSSVKLTFYVLLFGVAAIVLYSLCCPDQPLQLLSTPSMWGGGRRCWL